jgi:hypothetical protein
VRFTLELLTDTLKSWMAFTTSANIFLSDDLREVEIYFQEAVFLSLKKKYGMDRTRGEFNFSSRHATET